MYRLLPKRVGRRGVCLMAMSCLAFLTGWTQILQPPVGRAAEVFRILFGVMPAQGWGVAWIVVAVSCALGALWIRMRNLAYGLALFMLTVILIGVAIAAVTGAYRGWASVGGYTAWWIIFQTLAGWPEAGHSKIPHPRWRRRGPE